MECRQIAKGDGTGIFGMNRIVLVDPYSSGALLAAALIEREVTCVAVESSSTFPASMKSRFEPDMYCDVIKHYDFEQTRELVARHKPSHVIAGFESGVELAERLSHELALPSNVPELAESRRDKFRMAESAAQRGLRTAKQFRSSNVDEILAWTEQTLDWPVIAKPPKSVASDHVFRCQAADELRCASASILRETNVLGLQNSSVLVQEFLQGTEYVVDTVSCGGNHKLTAIWQYERPEHCSRFICYNGLQLLPYEGDLQEQLRHYAFEVLDALGVRFGPAHCELMWTKSGPTLVELGARLSAGNNAVLSRLCGGICQLDETVNVLIEPARFLAELDCRPRLNHRAANAFLFTTCRGKLLQTRYVEEIQALPTFHSMSIASQHGETIDGVAGRVTLLHAEWNAIQRDLSKIRELEANGMFVVEEQLPLLDQTVSENI